AERSVDQIEHLVANVADLGSRGIAKTEVQRQAAGELPLVVEVRCEEGVAVVLGGVGGWELLMRDLPRGRRGNAWQEILQARKSPYAADLERRPGVFAHAHHVRAETHAVRSGSPDHVVAHVEFVGNQIERQRGRCADDSNAVAGAYRSILAA